MRYALNACAGWLGRRWRSFEICSIQWCTVHHHRTWMYGDLVADRRLDREDWIAAGLGALERGGVEAVAVVPLARELGVTRGSFYWHFGVPRRAARGGAGALGGRALRADARRRREDRGPAAAPARDPRPRRAEAAVVLRAPARRRRPRTARGRDARALRRRRASRRWRRPTAAAASPPPTPAAARCWPTPPTSGSRGCRWPGPARSARVSGARSRITWSRRSCRETFYAPRPCRRRRPPSRPSPSACSRVTAAPWRGRSRSWSPTTRAAGILCARSTRTPERPRSWASPALQGRASRR